MTYPQLYGIPVPDCKLFNGFKPCEPFKECKTCTTSVPIGKRILIINFDAMGDVLQNTCLLPSIKRKYPESHITWLTFKRNEALLWNNPLIDRISLFDPEEYLYLISQEFDELYNLDKTNRGASLAMQIPAKEKLGFGLNRNGAIIPLNKEAAYLFEMGVSDDLKFKKNTRTMPDIVHEMLRLDYQQDEIIFNLTQSEKQWVINLRDEYGIHQEETVIGISTGCNPDFPNKKMTEDQYVDLIDKLNLISGVRCVLFGGPEDEERNNKIMDLVGYKVISTPTNIGQRKGTVLMNIADVIITGDAMPLYAGIALKKYMIAWFGVTCQAEVDLHDRGIKIYPKELSCSPCWKKQCPYNLECISGLDLDFMSTTVRNYIQSKATVGVR